VGEKLTTSGYFGSGQAWTLPDAYNITLDVYPPYQRYRRVYPQNRWRADRAVYPYGGEGTLAILATDLEFEGSRVKSPILGRDFNPMGRGDGAYYAQGSMAIYNAKPAWIGEITTGWGNSICNGDAIPTAIDLGGSPSGGASASAAGECCGGGLALLGLPNYSVMSDIAPGAVPPGWSGYPCSGYCPPCCTAGCICSGMAITCLCDLSKPWIAPIGAWVSPGHGLAGAYHTYMPTNTTSPWGGIGSGRVGTIPNTWEYCCGGRGYRRPPVLGGWGHAGSGGYSDGPFGDGGIRVRRGKGQAGGGDDSGDGQIAPAPPPPPGGHGGGGKEEPENCCCPILNEKGEQRRAHIREYQSDTCFCSSPGIIEVNLDTQSTYYFDITYPAAARCSCKRPRAVPPGWSVGTVRLELWVMRINRLHPGSMGTNCEGHALPQYEAEFDYICPSKGMPWPNVRGWALNTYTDRGGVTYKVCDWPPIQV